jgi:hypothetical protein
LRVVPALVLAIALGAAGAAQAATIRMFSYDPDDSETRHTAGPLTFEFRQQLIFNTVLRIRATEQQATAELKPVDDKALGVKGGLPSLIGLNAQERDLYEVSPTEEGGAMISAFCPGSKRAWMAFGRLRENRDLKVHVLGDDPKGGGAHLCHTLAFRFHGEWKIPGGVTASPRDMATPQFPYR